MLRTVTIPDCYESILNRMDTAVAIQKVKSFFQTGLEKTLHVTQVSSPIMVKGGTGVNDNLNGTERVVSFDLLDLEGESVEIVQSLAKWKRSALAQYGFTAGKGLYTDMKAVRRDETMDNFHSIYVDQWDWEKVIASDARNLATLKHEVQKIYAVLKSTESDIHELYPKLKPVLPDQIFFITAQELEDHYPRLSPKERENEIAKKHGAVFIIGIGGKMKSGKVHDGRSPDYDDWSLNGDIILWYPVLNCAVEISSMGIRVDEIAMHKQLISSNQMNRINLDFHRSIIAGELPPAIGGGIGQSRLCMFLLKKAHICEVQVSIWNEKTMKECEAANIPIL